MRIQLDRRDVLSILRDLEAAYERSGNYAEAVSIEVARAALKRVPELDRITYVSPNNQYVEAVILPEESAQ